MQFERLFPARLRVALYAAEQNARDVVRAMRTGARVRQPLAAAPRATIARGPVPKATVKAAHPSPKRPPAGPGAGAEAVVVFADHGATVTVREDQTILYAGLEAGLDLMFSCTLGGCGACMLKVAEGEVEYDDPDATCLTDEDRAEGLCLACVGRPVGRVVLEG